MSRTLSATLFLLMVLIVELVGHARASHCPRPSNLIAPCICANDFIDCSHIQTEAELKAIFSRLRDHLNKQRLSINFEEFRLRNSEMSQLGVDGDILSGIRFKKIHIQQNENLKAIKTLAFESTFNTTEVIEIEQNVNLGGHQHDCVDMFAGLNRFTRLTTLRITESGLRIIPEHAFARPQSHLAELIFSENRIETIGDNAFAALEALQLLNIDNNQISKFGQTAFNLTKGVRNTQRAFQVLIRDNNLQTSTFQVGVFTALKSSIHLILDSNNITKLPFNIFAPFFESGSSLSLKNNPLVCDCDFKWLLDRQLLFNSTREGVPYALRYYLCRIEDNEVREVDWSDFAHCPNCLRDVDGGHHNNLCTNHYYIETNSATSLQPYHILLGNIFLFLFCQLMYI